MAGVTSPRGPADLCCSVLIFQMVLVLFTRGVLWDISPILHPMSCTAWINDL